MIRLLGLLCLVALQGCAVLGDGVPATMSGPRTSEAAKIVIRNGASREIYVGAAPLVAVLKPSQERKDHLYTVRVAVLSLGVSREFVLNYDLAGWALANGENATGRRLPYGVLLLSSHGLVSAIPADEWNSRLAESRVDTSVGRDELVVMLTDESPPKMAMTSP